MNQIEEIKKDISEVYDLNTEMGLIDLDTVYKILDKHNKKSIFEDIVTKIQWYLNHLNNTKAIYNQKEISSYIQNMIIDLALKERSDK